MTMRAKPMLVAVVMAGLASVGSAQLIDDPVDPNLTPETRSLFLALHELRTRPAIAFGQHLTDWASSTQPTGSVAVSDWEAVTGTRPAMHEWDWIVLLNGPTGNYTVNQNAVQRVRAQYTEGGGGGIIGIAWHLGNPALEGQPGNTYNSHAQTPVVPRLLPGGDLHEHYLNNYLSKMGDAIAAMQVNGTPIPIIMRPYHEPGWIVFNGQGQATDGFWWNWSTPDEYKALWRMTVEYFRDTRGLRNLLWAYCPNWPSSQAFYDERYQREWIDICGADQYRTPQDPNPDFATPISFAIARAEADGKIVAYTEMGAQNMASSGTAAHQFWRGRVYQDLAEVADRVSYAMTWANWSWDQFYIPHANSPAAFKQDFTDFLATPEILHLDEMQALIGDLYSGDFRCSAADLAAPYGVLNFFDLSAFVNIFAAGCDTTPPTPPALSTSDLLTMTTAWTAGGTVASVQPDDDGVRISGTAGSASFAARSTRTLNLSGVDSFAVDIEVSASSISSMRWFFQTGSGFAWNEANMLTLTPGGTVRAVIDLSGIPNRGDIRAWGFQAWGAPAGSAVQLGVTPAAGDAGTGGPCSPADLAEPFGTLNFFDVSTYLGIFQTGCP